MASVGGKSHCVAALDVKLIEYDYCERYGIEHLLLGNSMANVNVEANAQSTTNFQTGAKTNTCVLFQNGMEQHEHYRVRCNNILHSLLKAGLKVDMQKFHPETSLPFDYLHEIYKKTNYQVDAIVQCNHDVKRKLHTQIEKNEHKEDGTSTACYVLVPGVEGCENWMKQDLSDREAQNVVGTRDFHKATELAKVHSKKGSQYIFLARLWPGKTAFVKNNKIKFWTQGGSEVTTLIDTTKNLLYPKYMAQLFIQYCIIVRADVDENYATRGGKNPVLNGISREMQRDSKRLDSNNGQLIRVGSKVLFKLDINENIEGILRDVHTDGTYLVEPTSLEVKDYLQKRNMVSERNIEWYEKYRYDLTWALVRQDGVRLLEPAVRDAKKENKMLEMVKFVNDCLA